MSPTAPVIQLTREDIAERLEQGARRRLGMSAEEFVRAYREGRLQEPCQVADLLALAQLLTAEDPLFVPV